jgi:hypothetical protein
MNSETGNANCHPVMSMRQPRGTFQWLWDGSFELRGEFFVVKTERPEIGP